MTVLLERETEATELREALARAGTGTGSVVLVTGEAGIGKTSLVRAFLRHAAGRVRTLSGACDDLLTPRTLGPLRDAARAAGPALAEALADGDRDAVLTAVLNELASAPTLVVLEDVHWADDATLDVLRYVGRRIEDVPALLVLTYRDEEVGTSLRRVLGGLGGARRLPLRRLSRGAVARLAGGTTATSASLYRSTGGNPFFVTEVLAVGDDAVPATVVDTVLARIRRLPAETRGALEMLSVVPGRVELSLARAVLDLEVLVPAEQLGVLEVRPDAVAFRHELARRAVADSLPASLAMRHHARILEALLDSPDADLTRAVHHAVGAGDDGAVITFAPVAASVANRAGAHAQEAELYAEVLARRALLDDATEAAVLQARAAALFTLDRMGEALETARAAVRIRERLGDPQALGEAVIILAPIQWAHTRPHDSLATAARAVSLLAPAGDTPQHAFALGYLALLRTTVDHEQGAGEAGTAGAAIARRLGIDGLRILGEIGAGSAIARLGDPAAGLARLRAAIDAATAAGEHVFAIMGYVTLVQDLWHSGRFAEVRDTLAAALPYAEPRDLGLYRDLLTAYRFRAEALGGGWDTAEAGLRSMTGEPGSESGALRYSLIPLARLLVRRDTEDAGPVLERCLDLARRVDGRYELVPAHLARLERTWLRGEPAPADSVALLRERTAGRGAEWQRGEVERWVRRLGGPAEVVDGCPEEWAAGIRGDWAAAAAAWERLGDPYEQALELADSGRPEPLLRSLTLLDDLGARPAAALVRRRLRDLGVAVVPRGPKPATRANPAGLTDRQLEILQLVASGATNAEIAARLVLSVRTVDHHVSATLQKLGVTSRREAAAALASL
ncbi:AAA family ATPase [Pseudonocardia ailaonensis]|uniref:AAA family ATPase n=1 Tax=Pseudonocardia ailaonensis TaxID=367279 RepID=A0ABN2N2U0_9PSEU